MHLGVLGPIVDVLDSRANTEIRFTSEYEDRIRPVVGRHRFISHAEARWRRFDLYLNADPWGAAALNRCAARVNFFHGVAGKYDLDEPVGLPLQFHQYTRVAFVNADRLNRYLRAQIVTAEQAALVGYPKLDRLAQGQYDGKGTLATLGFDAARPTALYAPTYSTDSSLHLAGPRIVMALVSAGFNVIVKLHDRSLDPDPRYTGGIDWRSRFEVMGRTAPVRLVDGVDASSWLAAADLMVTDHSSIGFEYLLLDRPLIVFDAPALISGARINPDKVALLRSAATVVRSPEELAPATADALGDAARLSPQRRSVAGEIFYDPGGATDRAVALIDAALTRSRSAVKEPTSIPAL